MNEHEINQMVELMGLTDYVKVHGAGRSYIEALEDARASIDRELIKLGVHNEV